MSLGHWLVICCYSVCADRFGFYGIDGEFRADYFAVVAVDAIIRFEGFRGMIAFCVETAGKRQDIPGAEFDAITASFAPVINDVDCPLCYFNYVRIKWNTPKFHLNIL